MAGNPHGFVATRKNPEMPLAIAGIGFVLFSLLSIFLYQLGQRHKIVRRLVEERTRELDNANLRLVRLSSIDEVTQLENRRTVESNLKKEWQRSLRRKAALAVMMMDIDYFKGFNDLYGHQAGDDCLRRISHVVRQQFERASDRVGRYGGEEIIAVLPETNSEATLLAERCRKAMGELGIPHETSSVSEYVTISVGVATTTPTLDAGPEKLVELADQALYLTKSKGRDRVESWESPGRATG